MTEAERQSMFWELAAGYLEGIAADIDRYARLTRTERAAFWRSRAAETLDLLLAEPRQLYNAMRSRAVPRPGSRSGRRGVHRRVGAGGPRGPAAGVAHRAGARTTAPVRCSATRCARTSPIARGWSAAGLAQLFRTGRIALAIGLAALAVGDHPRRPHRRRDLARPHGDHRRGDAGDRRLGGAVAPDGDLPVRLVADPRGSAALSTALRRPGSRWSSAARRPERYFAAAAAARRRPAPAGDVLLDAVQHVGEERVRRHAQQRNPG